MARKANSYEHLARLIEQAQTGDRNAFDEAYRLTAQAQFFALLAKTNADAAPDLLQEVYLIAWKNIAKIRPRSFVGYLNAVTRNVCLRYYERTNRPHETAMATESLEAAERPEKREGEHEHVADPAIVTNTRDEHRRLARALREELDDREREVVLMRFYQDMRIDDIAENLEISTSTVKRIVNRALDKLRAKLGMLPLAAFPELLRQTVESPLADGAAPKPLPQRRRPLDRTVHAVAAISVVGVLGCVGFAAAAHTAAHEPQVIEEAPVPAAESIEAEAAHQAPASDTTAPELLEMRSEQGCSLLSFADESGVADVQLTGSDGSIWRAEAVEEVDGRADAALYRFSVPSGTYVVTAIDFAGNVATGEIVVDLPPDAPGPYDPIA